MLTLRRLHAGQMLYLPAGWFHCVTSQSSQDDRLHLALNYWFHPPDNLDPGPQGLDCPYTSKYWPTHWALREDEWMKRAAVQASPQVRKKKAANRTMFMSKDHSLAKQSQDKQSELPGCVSDSFETLNGCGWPVRDSLHLPVTTKRLTDQNHHHLHSACAMLSEQVKPSKRARIRLIGLGRQEHLQCFA